MTVNIVHNQWTHYLTTHQYGLELVTIRHQEEKCPMLVLLDPMLCLQLVAKCTETDHRPNTADDNVADIPDGSTATTLPHTTEPKRDRIMTRTQTSTNIID